MEAESVWAILSPSYLLPSHFYNLALINLIESQCLSLSCFLNDLWLGLFYYQGFVLCGANFSPQTPGPVRRLHLYDKAFIKR